MPYKNIVFVKLEKRLLNDHRWFMMSEGAQLFFIKLILIGATTYNRLPKDCHALAKLCHSDVRRSRVERHLNEIKSAFPKFKENAEHYYFEDFEEKTNYIPGNPKESHGKSQGKPKDVVDKEEDKEEDKDIVKKKNPTTQVQEHFYDVFKNVVGEPYPANYAKDGAIFKRLLGVLPIDTLSSYVDRFFNTDDAFIKRAGYTVSVFSSQVAKLQSEKKKLKDEEERVI